MLWPVLQTWHTQNREDEIIALATRLGRRVRAFPALVTLLEDLAGHARPPEAVEALTTLRTLVPQRFETLVPQLLTNDRSWITQPLVYAYLHRRRTDLLTPYLPRQTYPGRLSTGHKPFVLPVVHGVHRWWPAQQLLFA